MPRSRIINHTDEETKEGMVEARKRAINIAEYLTHCVNLNVHPSRKDMIVVRHRLRLIENRLNIT